MKFVVELRKARDRWEDRDMIYGSSHPRTSDIIEHFCLYLRPIRVSLHWRRTWVNLTLILLLG